MEKQDGPVWDLCWDFVHKGFCPRGNKCRWSHEPPLGAMMPPMGMEMGWEGDMNMDGPFFEEYAGGQGNEVYGYDDGELAAENEVFEMCPYDQAQFEAAAMAPQPHSADWPEVDEGGDWGEQHQQSYEVGEVEEDEEPPNPPVEEEDEEDEAEEPPNAPAEEEDDEEEDDEDEEEDEAPKAAAEEEDDEEEDDEDAEEDTAQGDSKQAWPNDDDEEDEEEEEKPKAQPKAEPKVTTKSWGPPSTAAKPAAKKEESDDEGSVKDAWDD